MAENKKTDTKVAEKVSPQSEQDEAALKRVAKAMGIDYNDIIAREKFQKEDREVEINLGTAIVKINNNAYTGVVKVKSSVAEVLLHAADSTRRRILDEKIGKNFHVMSLAEGGVTSRLVGTVEG